jgi:hypothetical protein
MGLVSLLPTRSLGLSQGAVSSHLSRARTSRRTQKNLLENKFRLGLDPEVDRPQWGPWVPSWMKPAYLEVNSLIEL